MLFTVTYRGKDGALHDETVEAADRAGCVVECRKRGISPTKIVEGGKGKDRDKRGTSRVGAAGDSKRTTARWVAAVALIAVAAGGVWWWMARGGKAEPASEQRQVAKKPKAEKPQPRRTEPRPATATNAVAAAATSAPAVRPPKEVVSSVVTTNSSGAIIEKIVFADGTKKSRITTPPPIFSNACDQVIALAISAKPGEAMPPLPDLHGIDEDFAKSFLTPITINEDDPENVKELKRNVIETKKELLEAVKGGKTVMQALQEHQSAMERMESSRLMAIREMQRISAEDGVEMAQEFAKKVNEDFEGKGIPAIPVIGNNGEKTRRGNK